jgi:phosphate transport system ATP-binding protein
MIEDINPEVKYSPVVHSLENEVITISGFNVSINNKSILNDINLVVPKNQITCIIGPSGSGKSTLIRSINRINDDIFGFETTGSILFRNEMIFKKNLNVVQLRKDIGMVFQKPCVFPKSIRENVLFGIQHTKKLSKIEKDEIVEKQLKAAALWEEVSKRLDDKGNSLSIGQQQRLCIARTLAMQPQVILLDEPTSSLDPVSTKAIEEMMLNLKEQYTIVFVTHNIQQAKRIADRIVFMCDGQILEQGTANEILTKSKHPKTRSYLVDEYCAY